MTNEAEKYVPAETAEDVAKAAAKEAEWQETSKAESMMDREQHQASDWQFLEARYREDVQKMMKEGTLDSYHLRQLADTMEQDRELMWKHQREEREQRFDPRRSNEENADMFLHVMLSDRAGGSGDAVKGLSEMLNLYISQDAGRYATEDYLAELESRIDVADKFLEKFDEMPFINPPGGRENTRRRIAELITQAKKFVKDKEREQEIAAA